MSMIFHMAIFFIKMSTQCAMFEHTVSTGTPGILGSLDDVENKKIYHEEFPPSVVYRTLCMHHPRTLGQYRTIGNWCK